MKPIYLILLPVFLILTCDQSVSQVDEEVFIDRPFNLEATKGKYLDRIVLSWQSAPTAKMFEVFRYNEQEDDFVIIGNTINKFFEDSTVTIPFKEYYYKIRSLSGEDSLSLYTDPVIGYVDKFALQSSLYIQDETATDFIRINWFNAREADGYEIYRSLTDTLDFKLIATTTETYFEDTNLEILTDYYYKVRAFNNKLGKTSFTNIISGYLLEKYTLAKTFGGRGDGEGEFNYPYGILFDDNGNYYISEQGNDRIQKFDSDDNFAEVFLHEFTPRGMEWTEDGTMIVSISGSGFIGEYDLSGNEISRWSQDLENLREVDIDDSGNIFVVDYSNSTVLKFDANKNFITKWGSYGSGDGQFILPWGAEVVGEQIAISDANSIKFYSTSGVFKTRWNYNSTIYYISYKDGFYYLAFGNVIRKIDSNGKIIAEIGQGNIELAHGIGLNSANQLYLVDGEDHNIKIFELQE